METITPHMFTTLGGIEKQQDPRDITLGATVAFKYTFPATKTNTDAWSAPVEYQGPQPACGAHAGSKIKGLAVGMHASPRATWSDIKSFDGWPLDSGTDIRSIFKSITKTGVLDFSEIGNDVSLSEAEYAKALTAAQIALMNRKAGQGYGFIQDLSFNGLKQFINDHGPTLVLVRVSKRLFSDANGNASWAEKDILPLVPPGGNFPVIGGHFIVAHSYDEANIYFLNSFSDQWGRKGHGYFSADYMPFVNDAGALFPLSFNKDLYIGMTDTDVQKLQQYLNNHGFSVAVTGPGSVGQETTYFGSLTQSALKKFQAAHGIPNTGYFGPLTRAYIALHP